MKTTDLENTLNHIQDDSTLNQYLDKIDGELSSSFHEYFFSLPQVSSLSKSEIIKRSGIERTYAYHILDGTKENPGRDKILRLCIGTSLSIEETNRCLKISKESPLYAKSKRESLIQYAINQHLSVIDTNLLLEEHNEEELN